MKKRLFIASVILLGLCARRKTKTRSTGYTMFKATGIHTEFSHIDIHLQQATGVVTYKGQIHMAVMLDLKENAVSVTGSLEKLPDLEMDQAAYVDMLKQQVKFFIENNISDPKVYCSSLNN